MNEAMPAMHNRYAGPMQNCFVPRNDEWSKLLLALYRRNNYGVKNIIYGTPAA
jgi:hypothetical protein